MLPDIGDAAKPAVTKMYAKAIAAYDAGRYDEAASSARATLSAKSRTPNEKAFGHLLVGLALLDGGKPAAAEPELAKVQTIALKPADAKAYRGTALFVSGFAKLQSNEYAAAANRMGTVLRTYPSLRIASYAPGLAVTALGKAGRASEAPRLLTSVAEKAPGTQTARDARLQLAAEYEREKKLDLARATLEKLIKDFPETPTAKVAQQRLSNLGKNGSGAGGCCG